MNVSPDHLFPERAIRALYGIREYIQDSLSPEEGEDQPPLDPDRAVIDLYREALRSVAQGNTALLSAVNVSSPGEPDTAEEVVALLRVLRRTDPTTYSKIRPHLLSSLGEEVKKISRRNWPFFAAFFPELRKEQILLALGRP